MSGASELSCFFDDVKRRKLLRSLFDVYYADCSSEVIFDTSRAWCQWSPLLADLFPQSRIVCCVRNPAWVLDSLESHLQRARLSPSRILDYDVHLNVYSRTELLTKPNGLLGGPLGGFRQAWFGDCAAMLVVVRYEALTDRPVQTIQKLYTELGLEPFEHDFDHLSYEAPEFDAVLGLPEFHSVRPRVELVWREPVLPPDLFSIYDNCFWDDPQQNPRQVTVI
jgi:sulfotransferase